MTAIPQTDQLVNIASQDERYQLVTDSQEVSHILEICGFPAKWRRDITACLVILGEGDYERLWFSESANPYMNTATYHNPAFYGMKNRD